MDEMTMPKLVVTRGDDSNVLVSLDGKPVGGLTKLVITFDAKEALPLVEMSFYARTLQFDLNGNYTLNQHMGVYIKDGDKFIPYVPTQPEQLPLKLEYDPFRP
jgi:hypothetical protein